MPHLEKLAILTSQEDEVPTYYLTDRLKVYEQAVQVLKSDPNIKCIHIVVATIRKGDEHVEEDILK